MGHRRGDTDLETGRERKVRTRGAHTQRWRDQKAQSPQDSEILRRTDTRRPTDGDTENERKTDSEKGRFRAWETLMWRKTQDKDR